MESVSDQEQRKIFDTNVFGPIHVTKEFLPFLKESKGRVVFIGSMYGMIVAPGTGLYSASKAAISSFAAAFREEVKRYGITVSLVEPGLIISIYNS